VAQLVEALRYKPEGRGLDSRWCHWIFSLTQSFRPHYGPGVDSASNRNEYQEFLISNFRRVLYVVCFLLGNSPRNYPEENIQQRVPGMFLGGKGGRCVRLTNLPPSADCLEIWEQQPPGTLRACPGL
jgi:hypothetical protein